MAIAEAKIGKSYGVLGFGNPVNDATGVAEVGGGAMRSVTSNWASSKASTVVCSDKYLAVSIMPKLEGTA